MPELWIIKGRSPVVWRLPYRVTWITGKLARLDEAVLFLKLWRSSAGELLARYGTKEDGRWQVSKKTLHEIGELVTEEDPEALIVWSARRPADRKPTPSRADRVAFIDELVARGGGLGFSPEALLVLWKEFCEHAAHWLVNLERPLDLYFVRLHNCPYHVEWKRLLWKRFSYLRPEIKCKGPETQAKIFVKAGFPHVLVSDYLLFRDREQKFCYRNIEVEHPRLWWKLVRRAERSRMNQLGSKLYAEYFTDSLRRFIPSALAIFTSWMAKNERPSGADTERRLAGSGSVMQKLPEDVLLASGVHSLAGDGLPEKLPWLAGEGEPGAVLGADGRVPAMSDFRQKIQDLRKRRLAGAGSPVAKPGDGQA